MLLLVDIYIFQFFTVTIILEKFLHTFPSVNVQEFLYSEYIKLVLLICKHAYLQIL